VVGLREPSAPAKVPAPQGDPEKIEGQTREDRTNSGEHTTVNLVQVGQKGEDGLVAERNEDNPVVGQGRESAVDSHFLSSTRSTGGNEDTGVLSMESTLNPETTSSIPEGLRRIRVSVSIILSNRRGENHLPLSGERTVTSGDTEEERIVFCELSGGDDGVVRLGWGMELRQDFLGKSLCDPTKRGLGSWLGSGEKRRTERCWQSHRRPRHRT